MANACHFFVLGRTAPGTLYVIMGVRSLAAAASVNRKLMYLFLGVVLVGFFFSYKHPVGILGLTGTLLATYGSFQKSDQRVRVMFMLSAGMWMAHNILAKTPVAAIMEATFLTSNVLGYWRLHRRDRAAARPRLDVAEERTEQPSHPADGEAAKEVTIEQITEDWDR